MNTFLCKNRGGLCTVHCVRCAYCTHSHNYKKVFFSSEISSLEFQILLYSKPKWLDINLLTSHSADSDALNVIWPCLVPRASWIQRRGLSCRNSDLSAHRPLQLSVCLNLCNEITSRCLHGCSLNLQYLTKCWCWWLLMKPPTLRSLTESWSVAPMTPLHPHLNAFPPSLPTFNSTLLYFVHSFGNKMIQIDILNLHTQQFSQDC